MSKRREQVTVTLDPELREFIERAAEPAQPVRSLRTGVWKTLGAACGCPASPRSHREPRAR